MSLTLIAHFSVNLSRSKVPIIINVPDSPFY